VGCGGGKAPNSGIKLEVLPKADKPGLSNLPTLIRGEIPLFLVEVVVRAVPVRSWLGPSGDEGGTRGDGGVTGKRGVVKRFKAARVAEEDPEARRSKMGAGRREGSLVRRGGLWGFLTDFVFLDFLSVLVQLSR
jgi:hypothetical protein